MRRWAAAWRSSASCGSTTRWGWCRTWPPSPSAARLQERRSTATRSRRSAKCRVPSRRGRAAELAAGEVGEFGHTVGALRDEFERRLLEVIPDAQVNGASATRAPHVSNVSLPGTDSEAMLMHLDLAGIACSSGSACSTGSVEPSHVLTALGGPWGRAIAALRFSFGKQNGVAEGG